MAAPERAARDVLLSRYRFTRLVHWEEVSMAERWTGTRGSGVVSDDDVQVQIRLLGPTQIMTGNRVLHLGSARQRAVLALLALEAGKVVPSETLRNLLWEEDQPAAAATMQSLVDRLRKTPTTASGEPAQGDRLVMRTQNRGWILDVESDCVDALRFQSLIARARVWRAREDRDAAVSNLATALSLWRGAALVDVVNAGLLTAQAARLDEARLDAIEDLAELELETWRASEALARLEPHVEANRLRERGWGLLMVALYRLGRQQAALRAFERVRAILREELESDPSPQLAEIVRRVLLHDPSLGAPRGAVPGGRAPWTIPGGEWRPPAPSPSRPGAQLPSPSSPEQSVSTPTSKSSGTSTYAGGIVRRVTDVTNGGETLLHTV
jgi:DNA-binding SARP family transcriptional activator